ncbi:hypothetical protein [Paraburkholderia haematera]|uniref:Uncharacterized protein n=1 Tax=Paraburkholderia haematera TaxID=2793077 RepID=A0ABN7MHA8_9BURK|nr:hypothetical protein [Paraburkholderia haematera]CAE6801369.1 hypothetical protein R69888_05225 [Paraburkholderia haematera]
MSIRLVCASTFTALGLACSSTAFARVVVYMPAAVVYAPPPRPVYYYAPANPVYVVAPPPVPAPVPVVIPVAPGTPVPLPAKPVNSYSTVVLPAPVVTYAQPVLVVPR